jgi:hypothetical protein
MRVEVESYGNTRRDFYDFRDNLIERGKTFDEASLRLLSYHQLYLAAIGNAGAAVCSPQFVQREKARRRERFLAMEPEELKTCERYLRVEEMYDDVIVALGSKLAPRWDGLSDRQKLWAKLNCLYNHLDDPQTRIGEALLLLRKCSTTSLPTDVCQHYIQRMQGLMATYPGRVTDEFFRTQIEDIRDNIRDFLPDEEQEVCDEQQIADYSCTSDCFRVYV